ncbi:hypothetical protein [Clostridium ljungdahlii]|nr:hypothetical protein [Clostridium ljungdahlii]OAA85890.1 hypothetical protein WX45_00095 [Clostridium ljungdahlii DSM 13528]
MKNLKISILSILIITIVLIITKESITLHKEFKNVQIPTKQSRQLGNMSTYKWLTVKKISHKYNINEQEIFKSLGIIPHSGDENIPLIQLTKKYNKNQEQMKRNLKKLLQRYRNLEGKKHEQSY